MKLPTPERILELVAGDEEDSERRLRFFAWVLLVHLTARSLVRVLEGAERHVPWAIGWGLCLALSLHPKTFRAALWGAAGVATWKLAVVFPHNSNHFLIEFLCTVFFALCVFTREADRTALLRGLRWLPVIALLWSGVNKVVYGTYFNGAFLASTMKQAGFAHVFGLLMPAEQLQAILDAPVFGPHEFHAWPAIVASNLVYVGEIGAAILLLIPRLEVLGVRVRMLGVLAGAGVIAGIEAGAWEIMFGMLMMNLMVLFLDARWTPRFFVGSCVVYAALVLGRLGVLPLGYFN